MSDDKKSSRSDVKLATVQARPGDKSVAVSQGQIRVDQEFTVR